MKSLLFTFANSESRARFVKIISGRFGGITDDTPMLNDLLEDDKFIQESISTAQEDPCVVSSEHRHCSVWVSGKNISEGDFKKMNERFMQECSVHSASVVLKELKSNQWCDIRARRVQ